MKIANVFSRPHFNFLSPRLKKAENIHIEGAEIREFVFSDDLNAEIHYLHSVCIAA